MKLQKVMEEWERPEELIEISRSRDLTPTEALKLESTSFLLPIMASRVLKGKKEADKSVPIQCEYNLLRVQDNGGEDSKLEKDERLWVLREFPYLTGKVVEIGDQNGGRLEELLADSRFKGLVEALVKGARSESETVFAEQFGKGNIYRELHSLDPRIQEAIHNSISKMADGMSNFVYRGDIQTVDEFKDYGFDVAGSIGKHFLNRLVEISDGVILNDEDAANLGRYLQTINIIKGIRRDHEEGRVFLPAELHGGHSHDYVMTGIDKGAKNERMKCFDGLVDIAESYYPNFIRYTSSIPVDKLPGYLSFVLLPGLLGKETLDWMKKEGAEKVFSGNKESLKIPYGLNTIPYFVEKIVTTDDGSRVGDFLNALSNRPGSFPFEPGKFEKWAQRYFEGSSSDGPAGIILPQEDNNQERLEG